MRHPAGKAIDAHVHNPVARNVVARRRFFYPLRQDARRLLQSLPGVHRQPRPRGGDTILLASGGHGFEVLEEVEMIEVKQGPYAGYGDKTRFDGVSARETRVLEPATERWIDPVVHPRHERCCTGTKTYWRSASTAVDLVRGTVR